MLTKNKNTWGYLLSSYFTEILTLQFSTLPKFNRTDNDTNSFTLKIQLNNLEAPGDPHGW